MRLSGNPVSEETAVRIALGEYVLDATLEEHMMVTRLTDVLSQMDAMVGMDEELSAKTLDKFYATLSGGEAPVYRKSTPVLFHLSHSPVLPQEIDEQLHELFWKLHQQPVFNPLEQAVHVHNEIIRIYPYNDCNELVARAAMEYELIYQRQEMISLSLSEVEYNGALAEYMKRGYESLILPNLQMNKLMLESSDGIE